MKLNFYKYQGTGNDFVMIDNREGVFIKENTSFVKKLCDRKFGIGADGLILIENSDELDFNMIYYNADGTQSFCGNGSRCSVAFAKQLGIINNKATFLSTDGKHEALIDNNNYVSLKMHDVDSIEKGNDYYYINTGSPHYIVGVDNVKEVNLIERGREIRFNDRFKEEGTNVNFVNYKSNRLDIRTYERGVEDETLSCGTGVTACALSLADRDNITEGEITVNAVGGELKVEFKKQNDSYINIWLKGATAYVYQGSIEI